MSVTGLVSIFLAAILTNNYLSIPWCIQETGYSRWYECGRYLRYDSGYISYMANPDIYS